MTSNPENSDKNARTGQGSVILVKTPTTPSVFLRELREFPGVVDCETQRSGSQVEIRITFQEQPSLQVLSDAINSLESFEVTILGRQAFPEPRMLISASPRSIQRRMFGRFLGGRRPSTTPSVTARPKQPLPPVPIKTVRTETAGLFVPVPTAAESIVADRQVERTDLLEIAIAALVSKIANELTSEVRIAIRNANRALKVISTTVIVLIIALVMQLVSGIRNYSQRIPQGIEYLAALMNLLVTTLFGTEQPPRDDGADSDKSSVR